MIPGFAAYQAGIKKGDIITAIGSTAINCPEDVYSYFGGEVIGGGGIIVHIKRGEQNLTISFTVDQISEDYRWIWGEIISGPSTIQMPGIYI